MSQSTVNNQTESLRNMVSGLIGITKSIQDLAENASKNMTDEQKKDVAIILKQGEFKNAMQLSMEKLSKLKI